MIELTATPDGVLLPVKAQPGAKRNAIVGEHGGALKVAVSAAPEKGKANDAIIEVLAESLHLRRQQISLHRGATSTQKSFKIVSVTKEDLSAAITAALATAAKK